MKTISTLNSVNAAEDVNAVPATDLSTSGTQKDVQSLTLNDLVQAAGGSTVDCW
jgi:hypothetical protein